MNALKELGLEVYENETPDRQLVDFDVVDGEDNVAWAWGDRFDDVDWECTHPREYVEFGDEDEYGECLICGSHCSWSFVDEWLDEGHDETGGCIGKMVKTPEITEWYPRRNVGRAIGEYLKELEAENA